MASYDPNQPPHNPFAAGQNPPQPGAGSGSGCKIVALIVVILGLLLLCCCGGIFGFAWLINAESPAREAALEAIRSNPTCQEKLGVPIEVRTNRMSASTTPTTATASFTVGGPKGSAAVECQADKQGEQWVLTSGTVQFKDGTELDLLAEPAKEDGPQLQLEEDPNEIPLGAAQENGEANDEEGSSSETAPRRDIRN